MSIKIQRKIVGYEVVKEEEEYFGRTVVFDGADGEGHGPEGARGLARVPDSLIDDVIESAEECPGECIMIEPYREEAVA